MDGEGGDQQPGVGRTRLPPGLADVYVEPGYEEEQEAGGHNDGDDGRKGEHPPPERLNPLLGAVVRARGGGRALVAAGRHQRAGWSAR